MFQLLRLNVIDDLSKVPSVLPKEVGTERRFILTSALGWVFSTTVNVALPPSSVVSRPVVGATKIAALSLSVLVTETAESVLLL